MRVVISVGGSVLAPDLEAGQVAAHADVVERLAADGFELGVVVGGGPMARRYIRAARELGANEVLLDQLGIDVTRTNARLLAAALDGSVPVDPTPPREYDAAGAALRRGEVCVMGGLVAGQTTDAVAAGLAEYVGADLLVFATSVDGVYSADPNEDTGAQKYGTMSAVDLVELVAPMSRDAGASAPIDLLAAKLVERSGTRTVVLDGTEASTVEAAVRTGNHGGTDVVPEGEADPAAWDR
jgi:uridylate kinase